jgi:hypothetical protein
MNVNNYLSTHHALISFGLFQHDIKRSKMIISLSEDKKRFLINV